MEILASVSCIAKFSFFLDIFLQQHHFDTITHFSTISSLSILRCPLVFQEKGYLNFHTHLSIKVSKYFLEKLPSKTTMLKSFLSTLADHPGSFSKSCLELLFCRDPGGICFRRSSGMFQNFKNRQCWRL